MLSASSTMPTRKRSLVNEGEGEGGSGGSPKKSRTSKEAKPLDPKKFGGKTEEEVCQMLLPDHMAPGLDIIFMGINPGLYSAYMGHHYCNANNHFWPCLFESGLIPKKLSFREDAEVLNYGIGISNVVPRTTRAASELSRKEIRDCSKVMIERMQKLSPLIICFNGKGIYEIFTGGKCTLGLQEEPLPGTDIVVYVMPSTSGRAATFPRRSDKLKFFNELKELRDRLRREKAGHGVTMSTTTPSGTEIPTEQDSNTSQSSDPTTQGSSAAVARPIQHERPHQVAVIVNPGNSSGSSPSSTAVGQTMQSTSQQPSQVMATLVKGTQQASSSEIPADISTTTSPYFQH